MVVLAQHPAGTGAGEPVCHDFHAFSHIMAGHTRRLQSVCEWGNLCFFAEFFKIFNKFDSNFIETLSKFIEIFIESSISLKLFGGCSVISLSLRNNYCLSSERTFVDRVTVFLRFATKCQFR